MRRCFRSVHRIGFLHYEWRVIKTLILKLTTNRYQKSAPHWQSSFFVSPVAACPFLPPLATDLVTARAEDQTARTQWRRGPADTHSAWFILFAVLDLLIKQLREWQGTRAADREKRKGAWAKMGTVTWGSKNDQKVKLYGLCGLRECGGHVGSFSF